MRQLVRSSCLSLVGLLGVATASAQQFQSVTAFPGTPFWSEGVEAADVDHDGDLDLFVADGDGWSSAGTQRQNRLFINRLIDTTSPAPWTIVDESIARLGTHTSNAKGVALGDINGDGWVDALFSNAFSTQLPFLYVNQGAANPGFFTFEGVARGFTTLLSSGSASFGDVDDDGDLDVIINDAYNSGTTRRARLYINDGLGFFTENAAGINAGLKNQQMDVQFADIDGDWDIDFVGLNKGSGASAHYLMLNNGAGSFTDSSSVMPSGSGATYEGDVADLDGDTDIDMFFTSLSGFADGTVRNNIIPGPSLTFTNGTNLGGDDDNEITYIDYDNDGDYDVIIGSLGGTEKLYRNNGGMAFALIAGTIQAQADSTLDCTVVDLNNDGAYDLVTMQGESGNFTDKFYRNTGGADTLPPVLVAENVPGSAPSGATLVAKAKIRDQVLDDGVNYVSGTASYVVTTGAPTAAVSITAGGFSSNAITVAAGTNVTWTNNDVVTRSVVSTSTPYTYNSGALAPAQTFARVFVTPGVYNYTSTQGGFLGTVTVTGTVTTVPGLHMGGQMYRFAMADTASGAGVQVCYELRFRDWPGNTLVAPSHCVALDANPGTAYCFGDGTGTPCPCGNASALNAGDGCLSSFGTGGRLRASGTASVSADSLVLGGTQMPNSSALYFQGTVRANGGNGSLFGDGLRCAAGAVIRLGTKLNAAGASAYPVGADLSVSVRGVVLPGDTRHYQVWYRNAAAFCTADTFNVTNGYSISWAP